MNSKPRKIASILLLLLFVLAVLGRISDLFDYIFRVLGFDLFMRLITRLPWILGIIALLVSLFVFALMGDRLKLKDRLVDFIAKNKSVILLALGILVSAILSFVFAQEKEQSFYGVIYYILMVLEFLCVVLLWGGDIGRVWKKLNYVVIVILLVSALIQLLAFSAGGHANPIIEFFDNYGGFMPVSYFTLVDGTTSILRPSSLMADPNFLGIFASVVFFLGADEFVQRLRAKKIAWLSLIGAVSSLGLVLITNSRTAFVMLVAGVLGYGFSLFLNRFVFSKVKKTSRNHKAKAISFIWFDTLFTRIKDAFTFADGSSQEHLRFGRAAIQIFEAYPVLGVGIGNYPLYYQTLIDSTLVFATPHSAYFKALAELGLVGTVALLLFVLYFMQLLIRSGRAVFVAILFAILAGNLFYDFFMTPWVWFYLGVMYVEVKTITNS